MATAFDILGQQAANPNAITRDQLNQALMMRYGGQPSSPQQNAQSPWSSMAAQPNVDVPVPTSMQAPGVPQTRDTTGPAAALGGGQPAQLNQLPQTATAAQPPIPPSGSIGAPPPLDPNMMPPQLPAAGQTPPAPSQALQPQAALQQPQLLPGQIDGINQWQQAWRRNFGQLPAKAYNDFRNMNPQMTDQDVQMILQGSPLSPALMAKIASTGSSGVPTYNGADRMMNQQVAEMQAAHGERATQPMSAFRVDQAPDSFRSAEQEYGNQGLGAFQMYRQGISMHPLPENPVMKNYMARAAGILNTTTNKIIFSPDAPEMGAAAALAAAATQYGPNSAEYAAFRDNMAPLDNGMGGTWSGADIEKRHPDVRLAPQPEMYNSGGFGSPQEALKARGQQLGMGRGPEIPLSSADEQPQGYDTPGGQYPPLGSQESMQQAPAANGGQTTPKKGTVTAADLAAQFSRIPKSFQQTVLQHRQTGLSDQAILDGSPKLQQAVLAAKGKSKGQ